LFDFKNYKLLEVPRGFCEQLFLLLIISLILNPFLDLKEFQDPKNHKKRLKSLKK
jgi:hypothetical protein